MKGNTVADLAQHMDCDEVAAMEWAYGKYYGEDPYSPDAQKRIMVDWAKTVDGAEAPLYVRSTLRNMVELPA